MSNYTDAVTRELMALAAGDELLRQRLADAFAVGYELGRDDQADGADPRVNPFDPTT